MDVFPENIGPRISSKYPFFLDLFDEADAVDVVVNIALIGSNTGEGEGDDEQMTVDLTKVPADVDKIAISVTIHEAEARKQSFGMVSQAFVRVVNAADNAEIVRYDLSEDFSIETALVFGEIYRNSGEWKFRAVGQGFQGGLGAMAKNYGVNV